MKRKILMGALLGVLFLAGLIAALPASLLSLPLLRATGERWQFSGAQGTVWQGKTQLVYVGDKGEVLPMSRIGWHFQPKALLSGRAIWLLESDGQDGKLEWGWGGVEVNGVNLTLPVAALANLSKTWQAARLGGDLQVKIGQFSRKGGQLNGNLHVSWLGAASPLSPLSPFGSYQLEVNGAGAGVSLNVTTLDGPLNLSGQGQWQPGAAFALAGSADSPPEKYDALKPLMLMLGKPSGPNSVQWQIHPGV